MNVKRREAFLSLITDFKETLSECLTKHLPVNIFLVDKEGYVCWANARLLKIVNSTLEEVEGLHISTWDHARWECICEVILNQKETLHEESYQDRYFSTIRKPLFDENSQVVGVLGVSIEITDRKKAEAAKEQFLHNIRHDVRTPLSGIIGLTAVLRDEIDKPELLSLVDSLSETSESLLSLLDRVFESIELSTGEASMSNHRFSLKDILESVCKLHQAKAVEKDLTLSFYYDAAIPSVVVGEAIRVQRVIWELLTNALKYTENGSIALHAKLVKQVKEKITIDIEVKDTGIGIPPDKHEMVFDQFTRLTPAWTRETSGQGLGLFNVKKLIEDLKGEIFLKSAVGQGSTFTCRITVECAYPLNNAVDFFD